MLQFKDLGVYCRSLGMSWPPLSPNTSSSTLEGSTILRIGSRGDCSSVASDVSALELYSFYVINVNPLHTIKSLKQTVAKLAKSGNNG